MPTSLTLVGRERLTVTLALLACVAGFLLLRVASAYDSYVVLVLAFLLMIWGILNLFGSRRVAERTLAR